MSFDAIAAEYRHKIFRLAYAIVNDRELAEDAAQETLLRVWKGLPGFRSESGLSTWIYSIARNTALNVLQAAKNRPMQELVQPVPRAAAPARAGFDVEAMLSQLRPQYQTVVRLFYMQDKSYEEVAAMLDMPMGTVKTILHRARLEMAAGMIEVQAK